MQKPIAGSKGIIALFTRHPNAANLVMILMIIFGVFALGRINTQFFPTIETKSISVSISWPGASAQDVETNIIHIVEPAVRFIDGIDKMTSFAREGLALITLEFVPSSDMQIAVGDVESAVNAVTNLPDDAETPKIKLAQFFDRVARLAITGDVPEAALRIYAKIIRDDLIDRGIDKVSIVGLRKPELQVKIPETQLRRLGLTVSEVSRTIASNSRDLPSGQMKGDVEKQLRAIADTKSPTTLGELEIKAFSSGEKVTLADIATIIDDYEDGQVRGFSGGDQAIQLTVQRAPTADTLATAKILDDYLADIADLLPPRVVLKKYDVRANALTERIMLLVRNGFSGLGLVVLTLFIFLNTRVAFWVAAGIPVAMLATIGVMLVIGQSINMISLFALIMMLGIIVDDAIVVGEHTATCLSNGDDPFEAAEKGARTMVMPVSAAMITTAAAFAPILLISGIMGQIMGAMPMVVIAVIVASMVECFLILPGHLAHAMQPKVKRRWSYKRQMFFALAIGTLILSLSGRTSVDLAFAGSGIDLVTQPFTWSLTWFITQMSNWLAQIVKLRTDLSLPLFALLLAAFSLIAGAIIEVMIFTMSKIGGLATGSTPKDDAGGQIQQEGSFRRWFDKWFNAFRDGLFSKAVRLSFIYRYVTVSVAIGSVMVVVLGLLVWGGHLKFILFPSPEAENIRARVVLNAGIAEERAVEIITAVEKSLYATVDGLTDDNEELVTAVFITLGSAGRSIGDNLAEIRVQLSSSEVRSVRTQKIINAWRKNIPKLAGARRVSIFQSRGGPPGRDIDIEIYGNDVNLLKTVAGEIIDVVTALPGTSGISDDLPYGKPELVMELLPRGAAYGFTIEEVGRQVRNAFEGAIPRRFARGDDEITIRVTRTTSHKGAAALRNFELKSAAGEFIPLTEIVSLTERQGFSAIQRKDGKTTVSVTADLDDEIMSTGQAIEQLNAGLLPDILSKYNLDYQFTGRELERKKSFADLYLGTAIALSIIYIVLAWVFSDYWRPIAIMMIIPFGLVGAIFGHWILEFNLTILSLIGLLGLSGILVNDSIILVSRLDERLEGGETLQDAAIGASRDRLRAVLLTSLTTIGGLIPLMFEKSLQAQFLLPMAITIVFGLALATLLVLFLVPALIGIGSDIGNTVIWAFQNRATKSEQIPKRVQPAR